MNLRKVIVPLLLAIGIVVLTLALTRREDVATVPTADGAPPAPRAAAGSAQASWATDAAGAGAADAVAEDPGAAAEADSGVIEIDLSGNATFYTMLEGLGIEDLDGKLSRWAAARTWV